MSEQLPCNVAINYAAVQGDPILPFFIILNEADSVLNPAPGENQRFCYTLTGIGTDTSTFADLSHWVLGICPTIQENQIVNISVVIDTEEQTVTFPGNVELRTPENPDPPTGCPGLKFDFGLDKVGGQMEVCFELTTPLPVGPNPVCLFGGGTTASGLDICGPVCSEIVSCTTVGFQPLTVCAPVTVTPSAVAGTVTTFCCGTPTITPGATTCPGTARSCFFTITQPLCITVPVIFSADAVVGNPTVQCGDATNVDICTDCGEENG